MSNKFRGTLVVILLMLPLLLLLLWLVQSLQLWQCPSGSFLAGAQLLFLQNFVLMFCAAAFDLLLIYAAANFHVLFHVLGGEATLGNAGVRRKTVAFSAAVFLATGMLGLALSNASFCLTQSRILVRPWPWQDMRRFRWQDVDLVEARCRNGKGWSATLSLYLRSGDSIEIPHTQIADGFPGIRRAIHGLPVAVDTRGVDPQCGVPERDLLLHLK